MVRNHNLTNRMEEEGGGDDGDRRNRSHTAELFGTEERKQKKSNDLRRNPKTIKRNGGGDSVPDLLQILPEPVPDFLQP